VTGTYLSPTCHRETVWGRGYVLREPEELEIAKVARTCLEWAREPASASLRGAAFFWGHTGACPQFSLHIVELFEYAEPQAESTA
jgi:hypothetical protein